MGGQTLGPGDVLVIKPKSEMWHHTDAKPILLKPGHAGHLEPERFGTGYDAFPLGILTGSRKWRAADVRATLTPALVVVPQLAALSPELISYDELLNRPVDNEEVARVS